MIKSVLPKQNLKTLFETPIQPHLDYGIIFWGGTQIKSKSNQILFCTCTTHIVGDNYIRNKNSMCKVTFGHTDRLPMSPWKR